MNTGYDFRKEWPNIKKELARVSKEAMVMAKQGEKEIRRFSQKGKWQFDAAALKLKQNHLHGLIGKEYIKANCPAKPTEAIQKLVDEWNRLDQEIKVIEKKVKTFTKMTSKKE